MDDQVPQLQIFYGISSPWAYFGAQKAIAVAGDNGAHVRLRPIRIIEANGGIPLRRRPDARQLYHEVELRRWREYLGIPLNLKPKFYPCRTIEPAAQAVIALQKAGLDATSFSFAVQRALWAEERDIADTDTLRAIARATAGEEASALVVDPQPETIVDEWQENLAEAERLGIFGTPTYVVGTELFWGQDRLDFVDRALKAGRKTTEALKEPA
ncbi:2-hydroxychromene-2-carboxylate isomerase [Neorhizobium sp. BETTINA12A]|jgi:2-hydroxychromene-2-carboxylate isomerase|uniref:2-hydroxychromene-2-carboxylate isomerase n=1 Tax=Neorhizobium sp. BETTINA12A TaxID=2908924 RepID=UPI001FF6A761|nr:2-hydroxychromene-2-carboxylate isomerase [Neorhizobium sp. BETTINA12A]MCJ9751323.1 2-hydroxychromene-2-carboxylate isomerase [Neorhizobium sp. BETTINA12A]